MIHKALATSLIILGTMTSLSYAQADTSSDEVSQFLNTNYTSTVTSATMTVNDVVPGPPKIIGILLKPYSNNSCSTPMVGVITLNTPGGAGGGGGYPIASGASTLNLSADSLYQILINNGFNTSTIQNVQCVGVSLMDAGTPANFNILPGNQCPYYEVTCTDSACSFTTTTADGGTIAATTSCTFN